MTKYTGRLDKLAEAYKKIKRPTMDVALLGTFSVGALIATQNRILEYISAILSPKNSARLDVDPYAIAVGCSMIALSLVLFLIRFFSDKHTESQNARLAHEKQLREMELEHEKFIRAAELNQEQSLKDMEVQLANRKLKAKENIEGRFLQLREEALRLQAITDGRDKSMTFRESWRFEPDFDDDASLSRSKTSAELDRDQQV